MTTRVTVYANHGWPVDVKMLDASGTTVRRVPAGETQEFSVHSSRDLHIHEVQPNEIEADPTST
jgi:hypothetical protein